jgi:hypothetical protein
MARCTPNYPRPPGPHGCPGSRPGLVPPARLTWSELGRRPSALPEAPRGLPKSPEAAPGGCDLGPSCRPPPCSEAGRHPVTGGTARAAPSPARRAARSQAGLPPARLPPPLPRQHGREGAEAAPAGPSRASRSSPPTREVRSAARRPGARRPLPARAYLLTRAARSSTTKMAAGGGPSGAREPGRPGGRGSSQSNGRWRAGLLDGLLPAPAPAPAPGAPRGVCIASSPGLEMGDVN